VAFSVQLDSAVAPVAAVDEPVGHEKQNARPVVLAYEPAVQAAHALEPVEDA